MAVALLTLPSGASAQSFFATLVTDPAVGADRGSASQFQKFDEPTGFMTFSNTGSDVSGRGVLGIGYALPNVVTQGDQLDMTAVWAGPSDEGWRELLAGGVNYRFPLGSGDLTGFAGVSYGDLILGTPETLAFDIKADRLQVSAGLLSDRNLGKAARLKIGAEIIGRRVRSEVLGMTTIDEDLRMIRASLLYAQGIPNFAQRRFAISMTKGLDALGSSQSGNLLGSNPGAETDFLRASFAAETSVPLNTKWVINGGVIGQWTGDSLPVSQRCGYETNSYARAFDYAVIAGDRCFGSRVELAFNVKSPDFETMDFDATQAFIGIDGGTLQNLANVVQSGDHDKWSSLSVGVRTLRGNLLAEIAATRVLDRPTVAADQDRDRLWLQVGYQF